VNATWEIRDALLLAFEELSSHGVLTVPAATGETAQVRFELARALMATAPFGLGSYAFWLESDEHLFAEGHRPPLYTSGPEVDIALAAALAHQGYDIEALDGIEEAA
jgi:hypothetical protein